ncbi:MAG TPA: class I SAM-dependent methyltransferase [Vicinamibacterales bacterium]|jgi:SAM-dependent methyltransferase
MTTRPESSLTPAYADRLESRADSRWRKYLGVQLPYRWNLRRLHLGFVLDVGCGVGRNLAHLDGHGVGVDPNDDCVEAARQRGFLAYVPEDFERAAAVEGWSFDALLVAHVLEHVGFNDSVSLLQRYMRYLKPGGRVVLITPQDAGYRSDVTHVEFMDAGKLRRLCQSLGLRIDRDYSFPFPRPVGRVFTYNEFVVVAGTK